MDPLLKTLREVSQLWRIPPRLKFWDWAEKNRWLGKDVTAKPGRYHVSNAPFQKEPQEAIDDPTVQTMVLYWGKRLGKTEIMVNIVGGTIDQNPRNILIAYPTIDGCKNFSRKFFAPMIRSTPCLKGKIKDSRTKDANNTILSKDFPGGNISIATAGSKSSFRQVQAPVVICDEIDAMESTPEGDPVTLALGRAENYPDCIQVIASTATLKGTSRIESWYEQSDKRNWFCPCPKCGQFQVLKWQQVKWEGRPIEDTVYVCEHCNQELNDSERLQMVLAGEWKATAQFKGIRGYWLNGLNSTFPPKRGFRSKLHQFASEFLAAKHSGEAVLKAWINTFLCESWEVKGDKVDHAPLLDRTENYLEAGQLPAGVLCLLWAADVQDDRIEVEIKGFGQGEESWGIDYRILYGDPDHEDVWKQLDEAVSQSYTHPSGSILRPVCGVVDLGHKPRSVLRFTRPREGRRVYAVIGSREHWQPLVSRPKKSTIRKAAVFVVGTDTAKEIIYGRLRLTQPGPRFQHFPKGHGYDEEFFRQLTSEKLVTEYDEMNIPKERIWVKCRNRNEALDINVYLLAALDILHPNWLALARNLHVDNVSKTVETNTNEQTENAQTVNQAPQPATAKRIQRFSRFRRW